MKSLFARYLTSTLVLLFISNIIFAIGFISLTFNYSVGKIKEELSDDAEKIAEMSGDLIESGNDSRVAAMFISGMQAIVSYSDESVIITDKAGLVQYFADSDGLTYGYRTEYIPQYVLDSMYDDGDYYSVGTFALFYDTQHYTCGKIIRSSFSDIPIGAVFVSTPADSVRELIGSSLRIFYIILGVVLVLGVVISYFLAKSLSNPLRQISQAAHEFSFGNFDVRVPEDRNDEIGELAHNFNSMCESISKLEQMRSSFIANISHELKTPMTTIAGFADGILDGVIPPEKERDYLQIISNDTKRLSRLVVRMLEASRISSGQIVMHPGSFEINEIIRRSLLDMEQRIEKKNLDIGVDFAEDDTLVTGDVDYIGQVVYNLIDNACKYADDGGRLEIHTVKNSPKLEITVSNTGREIPPDQIKYIFDRFYKVDQSRSTDVNSAGLGLFMVKSILNMHGEDIQVASENGLTSFTFTLPLDDGSNNANGQKHSLPESERYEYMVE